MNTTDTPTCEVLLNPFQKHDQVRIPAGTPYRYRGEKATSRAARTVTVFSASPGSPSVGPPTITAVGSGGYWKDYTVTEDMVRTAGFKPIHHTYDESRSYWAHQQCGHSWANRTCSTCFPPGYRG